MRPPTSAPRSSAAPFAVGAYIGAAYFFTSSTSFANPAVTLARTLSETFAGIAPSSVPAFVVAQLIGAALAVGAVRILYPGVSAVAAELIMPHPIDGSGAIVQDPALPLDATPGHPREATST